MVRLKKTVIGVGLILAVAFVATHLSACIAGLSPVDMIQPHKAGPHMAVPPGTPPPWPHQPYVNSVQLEVSTQDKIYFDLFTSVDNKGGVTFSKYTFFDRRTGEEMEMVLGTPDDLGPFQPRQQYLVAFSHPVAVPSQPDIYELRVYLREKLVASGLIEVKEFSPVEYIGISRMTPGVTPDLGSGTPGNPHPDAIQGMFNSGDKVYLGLIMNKDGKSAVTFSRYTSYNRRTGQETALEAPGELGPFQPGQIVLVAFHNPWPVPEQPGTYEVRIYLGADVVASAVFEVK